MITAVLSAVPVPSRASRKLPQSPVARPLVQGVHPLRWGASSCSVDPADDGRDVEFLQRHRSLSTFNETGEFVPVRACVT